MAPPQMHTTPYLINAPTPRASPPSMHQYIHQHIHVYVMVIFTCDVPTAQEELKRGRREALRRVTIVHRDSKNGEVVHFAMQTKQRFVSRMKSWGRGRKGGAYA